MAQTALEAGVDGMIATNTTLRREEFVTGRLASAARTESGGLSGKPLRSLAIDTVRRLRRVTGGRVPIIGVGGIANGADALEFVRAGATLVQLYTALVYEGPGLVRRIKQELAGLLKREGFPSVADAVGSAVKGAA
jgi:dihydroorotate dehydrogenase